MNDVAVVLAVGQRWQEVDPRLHRVIEIVEITEARIRPILIKTVESDNPRAIGRATWADKSRFNGKRGGYKLTESA